MRHRDGHGVVGRTVADPQDIARRLDGGRVCEPGPQNGNMRDVAMDGEHGILAMGIFRHEDMSVRGPHAVRSLERCIGPDIHRMAGFARGVHGNTPDRVGHHAVGIQHTVQEGQAVNPGQGAIGDEDGACGRPGRDAEDGGVERIADIGGVIGTNGYIVADAAVARQFPARFGLAAGEVEAEQGAGRRSARRRRRPQFAGP